MSERILVIDDDELVLSGLAANLSGQGLHVGTAGSCAEAMISVAGEPPDLVLCDLVLGDGGGIDLMKRIRDRHPELPFVVITGHGSVKTALEALRSGAADYIQKPADPDEVVHRIRTVLHAVHLRRSLEAEREKLERRQREHSQHKQRSDRMTAAGMMAAGAAQSLRDLLRPVMELSPAIQGAIPAGHAAHGMLADVAQAGEKADRLLGDLHYIGTGTVPDRNPVDLATLLHEVTASPELKAMVAQRPGLKIQLDVADGLPPVEGSEDHLRRALVNLLTFSAEPLDSSGLLVLSAGPETVERGEARGVPGDYVAISLVDNGPGLSVEDVERIFEPFYPLRLGRKISGLALALVYRVVTDHGGFVDVSSAPGRGATFSLFLPASGSALEKRIELRPDYSGGETILIVDDHADYRRAAKDMLEQQGYRVLAVSDGASALARLDEHARGGGGKQPIDLVVLDYVLGDAMDGLETYRKMIEIAPRQKAVMASGFADLARLSDARRLGVGRCIVKPYTLENLGRAVREVLDD